MTARLKPDSRAALGSPLRPGRPRRGGRNGYTLLELLVATLVGSFLLGGLYLAFHMTLTQTQLSRDLLEGEDLARGVFNRVALDVAGALAPLPPKAASLSTNSTAAAAGSGTAATDGTASMDPTGEAVTDPATIDPSQSAGTAPAPNLPLQGGILGLDDDPPRLVIFASRVPNALSTPGVLTGTATAESQQSADLRRIIYWRSVSGGLCREERPWVTADQIGNSTYPDRENEDAALLADNIVDVLFEYYDGSGWSTTWDGNGLSATGSGIAGPPRAIRITLTFEFVDPQRRNEPVYRTYTQIIPIRTAPGNATVSLVDPVVPSGVETQPDTGGDTTTGGTDTGTGAGGPGGTGGAAGGAGNKGGAGGGRSGPGGATGGKGGLGGGKGGLGGGGGGLGPGGGRGGSGGGLGSGGSSGGLGGPGGLGGGGGGRGGFGGGGGR